MTLTRKGKRRAAIVRIEAAISRSKAKTKELGQESTSRAAAQVRRKEEVERVKLKLEGRSSKGGRVKKTKTTEPNDDKKKGRK